MKKSASGFLSFVFLLSTLLLAVFSGCSDKSLQEQAASFSAQANTEIGNYNFQNAEQLLLKSIRITEELKDKPKLVELYSTLSTVHLSLGKYSAALSDLSIVRNSYNQIADRKSEIPVMIEMGKLSFQLGMEDDATAILKEAILSAQIHRFDKLMAQASFELGTILHSSTKNEDASTLLQSASNIFFTLGDTVLAVNASVQQIACLVALNRTVDAKESFASIEPLLRGSHVNTETVRTAYTQCGFAFLSAKEWNLSRQMFQRALSFGNTPQRETDPQPYIGLGEMYFNNFAFPQAEQNFEKAYRMSKQIFGSMTEAYLCIRIADCGIRLSEYSPSKNNQQTLIAAAQYYERAQSIFTRLHFGIGEALVLHRIGLQKELSGDDNAAIAYYKHALANYEDNDVDEKYFSLPVAFSTLWNGTSEHQSVDEFLSARLISLLLRYHRYNEAYRYYQSERTLYLRTIALHHHITFQDQAKNGLFAAFASAKENEEKLGREMFYAAREKNRNYLLQVQEQHTAAQNTVDKISFTQFPELTFLCSASDSAHESTIVPAGITVLDYFIGNNECWAFVLQNETDITAVKLSTYGYELRKKMGEFKEQLFSAKKDTALLSELSEKLYSVLIQPLEKFGKQRFVIIPPIGINKFPFHALSKNGKPLISMIEVSYLPASQFLRTTKRFPKFLNNIVAFGYTPDPRWGLEFELRDIRSFFRNPQIFVNQNATKENLEKTFGEMLQISSPFTSSVDGKFSVTLSDGNPSPVGVEIPISTFASLHPFPLVYMADIDSKGNDIGMQHSLYWLMNGTSSVITTQFPVEAKMTRLFGETFYSTLSSTIDPYGSYRRGVQRLIDEKDFSGNKTWRSFFYYGW
jgi:hypothetical protein